MDKSNCEFGKELEHFIAQKFVEIGYPNARRSNGSGNKGEAGDISGQDLFTVECKNKNTDSITVNEKVWAKLKSEIPLHSKRLPLYILRNKNKQNWAVMDVDDLFRILKQTLDK
jgi:Holliday junction resolvase